MTQEEASRTGAGEGRQDLTTGETDQTTGGQILRASQEAENLRREGDLAATGTESPNQQPSKEENTLQKADNESYELEDAHFTTATEETFNLYGAVGGISKLTSTPKLTKMQARQMGIDNSPNFNSTRNETPYSRAFKIQHSKTRRQRAPQTEYETPVIESH